MMKRKRHLFAILGAMLLVVSFSLFASYQKQKNQPVFLDNQNFQRYQDRWGLWVDFRSEKLSWEEKCLQFGSLPEEVALLNQMTDKEIKKPLRPLFIPYGREFANSLQEAGIFREAIETPEDLFLWPVIPNSRSKITSRIGRRWNSLHTGIDIGLPKNSIVLAAADGVVEVADRNGDYGLTIKIYHPEMNHFHTVYGHNNTILVKEGDIVRKGQIIGYSGNTGKSTGPHVHFEVRYHNVYLNPENFLPAFDEKINTSMVSFAD